MSLDFFGLKISISIQNTKHFLPPISDFLKRPLGRIMAQKILMAG